MCVISVVLDVLELNREREARVADNYLFSSFLCLMIAQCSIIDIYCGNGEVPAGSSNQPAVFIHHDSLSRQPGTTVIQINIHELDCLDANSLANTVSGMSVMS